VACDDARVLWTACGCVALWTTGARVRAGAAGSAVRAGARVVRAGREGAGVASGVGTAPRGRRLATPGWLDGRLVLGVLLVLVSVVLGARVLASADESTLVWSATRPLAAGTQLGEGDLELTRARLFAGTDRYLAGEEPVGYVLLRSVGEGELLPGAALASPAEDLDVRAVTVPVSTGHLAPDLAAGQQVDVWVTPDEGAGSEGAAGGSPGVPRLVVQAVTVLQRPLESAGEGEEPVVLQVPTRRVVDVLAAVAAGRIDLVRVPERAEAETDLGPQLEPEGSPGRTSPSASAG
jgi:hypothetical protein